MRNVHVREMGASIEQVRPWIEAAWTSTPRDPFPRDYISNWRKNPLTADPLALIPNVTRIGHGPFSFRFQSWDGHRWRVSVETQGFEGWHGFDLESTPRGCRVTHTLEVQLTGTARFIWPLCFAQIHDWAVEATFDRIDEALRTGKMPDVTRRGMSRAAGTCFRLIRAFRRRLRRSRVRPVPPAQPISPCATEPPL